MPYTDFIIDPPIIAHRGACRYAPENTMVSFLKAQQMGARWIEFDVMLTSDHEVIVIHDETLDRTTNGRGNVSDYPYSYLKTLDAGSWFDPSFAGEKIPLLTDVIKFLRDHQMSANIEIKSLPEQAELTAKKVMAIIKEDWTDDMLPPLISSFSIQVLNFVRQCDANCWIGLLMHDWMPDWKSISDDLQCISVDVNEKILDRVKIAEIKSTNRFVLAYTVNKPQRARELLSLGVDAIYTDCPDIAGKL